MFTTQDLRDGVDIELIPLSVRTWLKSIDPSYGKYSEQVLDCYDNTAAS